MHIQQFFVPSMHEVGKKIRQLMYTKFFYFICIQVTTYIGTRIVATHQVSSPGQTEHHTTPMREARNEKGPQALFCVEVGFGGTVAFQGHI